MKKYRELRKCLAPFQDCYSSGPIIDKSNGRQIIKLLGKWGGPKKTSKTYLYARYLYCVHTGRVIPRGFDVDHIDGNKCNDTIPNLRMLPHLANLQKRNTDPSFLALHRYVRLVCLHCSSVFIKHRNETHLTKNHHATYCSEDCRRHFFEHLEEEQSYEEFQISTPPTLFKSESWEEWSEPMTEKAGHDREFTKKVCWCRCCLSEFQSTNSKTRYCSTLCKEKGPATKKENNHEKNVEVLSLACTCAITWRKAGQLLGMTDNAAKRRARKLGLVIPIRKEKLID